MPAGLSRSMNSDNHSIRAASESAPRLRARCYSNAVVVVPVSGRGTRHPDSARIRMEEIPAIKGSVRGVCRLSTFPPTRLAHRASATASTSRPSPNVNPLSPIGGVADSMVSSTSVTGPGDPGRGHALERWLREVVASFTDRIAFITTDVAYEWGRMNAIRSAPASDALLAPTAGGNRLILVTRNETDVSGPDVNGFNPFMRPWPVASPTAMVSRLHAHPSISHDIRGAQTRDYRDTAGGPPGPQRPTCSRAPRRIA